MSSEIISIAAAYIIGSIPFGVLTAKIKGVDLRSVGSGNIGATNVLRTTGKLPALITLLGDFLKGTTAVLLCRFFAGGGDLWEGAAGLSAIVGHVFPVFLSFKGGKGVATGFGVLAAYSPVNAVIILIVWLAIAVFTRYSSLAALTAYTALPVIAVLMDASKGKIVFLLLIALLIIWRHASNIRRLLTGTESKIGR